VREQALPDVQGIDPTQTHAVYQLTYRTGPDEQTMDFIPGIGLTTFIYVHHGTISEAHLKLVALSLLRLKKIGHSISPVWKDGNSPAPGGMTVASGRSE
jgi:hypothetical protein